MSALGDWRLLFLLLAAPAAGSFVALLCVRLPEKRPVLLDRSRCDGCGATLGPLELAPIISWVAQRGRCRRCAAPIGVLPIALEIAAFGVAVWALAATPPSTAPAAALLGWTLLALSVIDARTLMLPDPLTLPLLGGGLAFAALGGPTPMGDAVAGAAAGGLSLGLVASGAKRALGRAGLGFGDVKLFAAAGAWVGWRGLPEVLLVASLAGLVAAALTGRFGARRSRPIAFGPFLAFGLWFAFLHGPLLA